MSFVQALSEQITLDELAKTNASIVIIGNGEHKHIDDYAEVSSTHLFCILSRLIASADDQVPFHDIHRPGQGSVQEAGSG